MPINFNNSIDCCSLSTSFGILVIQQPLKALKLRPQLLNLDYSKLLMNGLTFKENLCHVSILYLPLNQI